MATTDKDTVYIDIDDEITAIIDKLQVSESKIVALVLPKRAAVLQSIVNMKLLKRAADSANKNLVLITSEAGLLPLAGAAGVHVAKNLQSKPEIPDLPKVPTDEELSADVPEATAAEADDVDRSKSVGELATKSTTKPEETIEVDNDAPMGDEAVAAGAAVAGKKSKASKGSKNKIPNFDKFRKRLFLGVAAFILLLVFWFMAVFTLPKAKIIIKTDTSNQAATANFTASPGAQSLEVDKGLIPAKAAESAKADTQKTPATGQKDAGTRASGSVTISNCKLDGTPATIPAGTAVSANGLSFITQTSLSLDSANFTGGGSCKTTGSHVGSTNVVAQANGDQYNLSAQSYSVAGQTSEVKASGSAMGGGSSKIIKVVAQADVDGAKAKLNTSDDAAKEQLKKTLQDDGYYPLIDTFTIKGATTTVSPNVGEEGSEVTITAKGTYSMLGVKEDDLKKVVEHSVKQEIDADKQQVQDYGLANATYKVTKAEPNGDMAMTMDTQIAVGPKIDENQLKAEIAGKKRGDTENTIKSIAGVKDVQVKYSPFWVTKTPKKTAKITLVLEKAN